MDNTRNHLLWVLTAVAFLGACAGLWLARLRSTGAVQERFEAHFHLQPVCEPQRFSRNPAALIQKEWVLYMTVAGFVAPFWCALAISTERTLHGG